MAEWQDPLLELQARLQVVSNQQAAKFTRCPIAPLEKAPRDSPIEEW